MCDGVVVESDTTSEHRVGIPADVKLVGQHASASLLLLVMLRFVFQVHLVTVLLLCVTAEVNLLPSLAIAVLLTLVQHHPDLRLDLGGPTAPRRGLDTPRTEAVNTPPLDGCAQIERRRRRWRPPNSVGHRLGPRATPARCTRQSPDSIDKGTTGAPPSQPPTASSHRGRRTRDRAQAAHILLLTSGAGLAASWGSLCFPEDSFAGIRTSDGNVRSMTLLTLSFNARPLHLRRAARRGKSCPTA